MWKLRDIILSVVLSIVCGVLYLLWDWLYNFAPAQPVAQAAFNGLWLLAAVLVAVIVRRPGAALLAEVIAAVVEALLGGTWGGTATLLSGLLQGFGAEVGFAVFAYKRYNVWVAWLAGALSGVAFLPQWWTQYQGSSLAHNVQVGYIIVTIISGAIFGGWLPQAMAAALKRTGVLRNFAIGRQISGQAK